MDYSPEICDKLKIHCENGKSLESFCAHIGVSPKIIIKWYEDYPEFKEAVELAPCLEIYYWEMTLIRALARGEKESINVSKSRLEKLEKYVMSPLKKNTYKNLKEPKLTADTMSSTGDLVQDFDLLHKKLISGRNS